MEMKTNIKALASFRILKMRQSPKDKGLAIVKVKSLSKDLCRKLQKVRHLYWLATAECYVNSQKDINMIASCSRSFDFHIVSSNQMAEQIRKHVPEARCMVLGAGEYLTDPKIFNVMNEGERDIDFIASANSFWTLKNFHKIFEMQKILKDQGIHTKSIVACGSIKEQWYYDDCASYVKKYLGDDGKIIIGSTIKQLKKLYNNSRFLVHLSNGDSSPRCIFEAILSGCRCIVAGPWIHSLNDWLSCGVVHQIRKNDYSALPDLLKLQPDYNASRSFNGKLGLKNVWPKITEFCISNLDKNFSSMGLFDSSCVGKQTFRDKEMQYAEELTYLEGLL